MVRTNFAPAAAFGPLTVERIGDTTLPPTEGRETGTPVTHSRYSWFPPSPIRQRLPSGFSLRLDCFVGPDGLKRFAPTDGYLPCIRDACRAGIEIVKQIQGLNANQTHSYCAMFLIFNQVRGMHEHFSREFHHSRDLFVRLPGRESRDQRTVLPADVGKNADGTGSAWTSTELAERGKAAARARNITLPTMRQAIHFGLVEAARLNPLHIATQDVPLLIRTALFDLPSKKPAPELMELVSERILVAIEKHKDDISEQFDRWFSGPNNNFIKAIADQPRSAGGKLEREIIRGVILERGWEAFQYVANCIRAVMRYFQNSLQEELNDEEQRLFEEMFLPQEHLGGLPLLLLMERSSLVKSVVVDMWSDLGDRESVPVLHRLFHYYSQMVANRRAADRRFKDLPTDDAGTPGNPEIERHQADPSSCNKPNAAVPRPEVHQHVRHLGSDSEHLGSPENPQSDLSVVVEYLRGQRGLPPRCNCGFLKAEFVGQSGNHVELNCACECGKFCEQMTVTTDEIRKAGVALGIDAGASPPISN